MYVAWLIAVVFAVYVLVKLDVYVHVVNWDSRLSPKTAKIFKIDNVLIEK